MWICWECLSMTQSRVRLSTSQWLPRSLRHNLMKKIYLLIIVPIPLSYPHYSPPCAPKLVAFSTPHLNSLVDIIAFFHSQDTIFLNEPIKIAYTLHHKLVKSSKTYYFTAYFRYASGRSRKSWPLIWSLSKSKLTLNFPRNMPKWSIGQ